MKRFFPGAWPGVVMLVLLMTGVSVARSLPRSQSDHDQNDYASQAPAYCATNHNIGKLVLSVTNYGTFAAEGEALFAEVDCFTGGVVLACEAAVGLLDLVLGGRVRDAEDLVEVLCGHGQAWPALE